MSTAIIPVIIPDAVLDFLDTCSNEQIAELFTRMRQMTSRESITGSFVVDKKRNKGKKINRVPKVAGESVQDATNVSGAKRSLNSFMAFRKYYIPIFPWLQQKEMSGFITILWREDPFHAKWTIVARAYSIIRDRVGKLNAPLGLFLDLVCPQIGIIARAHYLPTFGWTLTATRELVRTHVPDVTQFSLDIRTTNMSVDDVVQFCRVNNYFRDPVQPAVVPTAPAAPTVPANTSTNLVVNAPAALTMAVQPAGPAPANAVLGPNSTEEEWFNDFAQRMYNAVGRDPTNPAHNLVGSGDQGSLDMLANGVALAAADDSYPFSAQFNPDDDCGLFWDPNDEFTSYDVGGLADFDPFLNPAIWGN